MGGLSATGTVRKVVSATRVTWMWEKDERSGCVISRQTRGSVSPG
jgi:hypothetical protein